MKERRKNSNKASKEKIEFLKFEVLSLGLYFIVFILGALAALVLDIKNENYFYVSLLCLTLSCFISAFLISKKKRHQGLKIGIIYTLIPNLLFLLLAVIFSSFKIGLNLFAALIVLTLCGALGGIFGVNKRIKR